MGRLKGRKVSVYLSPEAGEAYGRLKLVADRDGFSASQFVSNAVINEYYRQLAGVKVSAGAYGLLSEGDFDSLVFHDFEEKKVVASAEASKQKEQVRRLLQAMHSLGTGESEAL